MPGQGPQLHAGRTRVLLIDDHDLVIEALRRLLADEPDIEVVGMAASGKAALQLAAETSPDVVVVDYSLPDMDGAAITAAILKTVPGCRVLMLTGSDDPRAIQAAFAAGCIGYLEKTSTAGRLPAAIRAAAAGETFLSPGDLERLRDQGRRQDTPLTAREMDILALMALGRSSKAIAEELFVSVNTVRTHTQTILEKLGAHSRLEAVSVARRLGLVNHGST